MREEEYSCVLAEAAAVGNVQEVQWLMAHAPTGNSAQLPQAGRLALFAAVLGGHHAVCQLVLEWLNPNKGPMELPMCTYEWSPDTTGKRDISFLGLAYEWRKIQGKQFQALAQHYREYDGEDNASWQYLGLLELLLEYQPSLSLGAEGLFQAIAYSADVAAIQLLLQHQLDANAALSDGNTLLHLLVGLNSKLVYKTEIIEGRGTQIGPAVRTLLEAGASPLARNNTQKTPLDVCSPYFSSIKTLMQETLQPRGARNASQHRNTSGGATCSICMDRPSVMVLVPCGHLCVCQECCHHAQQRCPICRTTVAQMVRTYAS